VGVPRWGEHTEGILREAGYSDESIVALKEAAAAAG